MVFGWGEVANSRSCPVLVAHPVGKALCIPLEKSEPVGIWLRYRKAIMARLAGCG